MQLHDALNVHDTKRDRAVLVVARRGVQKEGLFITRAVQVVIVEEFRRTD